MLTLLDSFCYKLKDEICLLIIYNNFKIRYAIFLNYDEGGREGGKKWKWKKREENNTFFGLKKLP